MARYAERLSVPWWLWAFAVAVTGLLAAEVYLGAPGLATWVPYVVLLPITVATLRWLGRIRIEVSNGELRVDDARLPVRYIGEVTTLGADDKRDLLGPYAEPYAFVIQRPWIGGAVQVRLEDPDDPTPYWIVSSRRPAELTAALRAEQTAASPAADPR